MTIASAANYCLCRATGSRTAHAAVAALLSLGLLSALAARAAATAPYAAKAPVLSTPWTQSVSPVAPLPSYPRPQLERPRWLSLNGQWQYQQGRPGEAPPFGQELAQTILVPFPVQSPLSGIERGDRWGWYRRTFVVPTAWRSEHLMLNFGAVSWLARVYVNRRLAGTHRGDYDAFSLDITRLLRRRGPNELTVGFFDPIGGAGEPVGKQISAAPYGVYHTASSGIWQPVWLEPVGSAHITDLDLTPDLRSSRLTVSASVAGNFNGQVIAEAHAGTRVVASGIGVAGHPFALRLPHPHLWSPSDPYLYGLTVELLSGGTALDQVQSYFGMRSISLGQVGGATRILLNGRFVFETGALDQGYWPDGLYTAPSDAALRFDILAARRLGYNLLREHAKVEPDRWYYWADKLGILVWQDMPNMPVSNLLAPTPASEAEFRLELSAIVVQRRSHPSIVSWVPFNEGWEQFDLAGITEEIKRLDPSRLVDTQSGSANCCNALESSHSDVRDSHVYFGPFAVPSDHRASVIGEYGGVLPIPPPAHRWPGILTSIGSPVGSWPVSAISALLRGQYAYLAQEMRIRGLSAAVFTELGSYEQELGIISYDRRLFMLPPSLVAGLNHSLIAASERRAILSPQRAAVPAGTTGLWNFDEALGSSAADASGGGHTLSMQGGASWTRGVHGGALAITAPGQSAVATGPTIDTAHSFTVSAWLSSRSPRQSGTAVSEPGPDGSSFSLGIETTTLGRQSLPGEVGRRAKPSLGLGTWWTFIAPGSSTCTSLQCGVRANLRYDDGRYSPAPGSWHLVTGVYDSAAQTISLYVDGIPEDMDYVPGLPPAQGPLTVGAGTSDYAPTDTFLGAIDGLRTYARALTPAEVWQLYRAARVA